MLKLSSTSVVAACNHQTTTILKTDLRRRLLSKTGWQQVSKPRINPWRSRGGGRERGDVDGSPNRNERAVRIIWRHSRHDATRQKYDGDKTRGKRVVKKKDDEKNVKIKNGICYRSSPFCGVAVDIQLRVVDWRLNASTPINPYTFCTASESPCNASPHCCQLLTRLSFRFPFSGFLRSTSSK